MDSRTVLLLVATQVCLLAVVRCQEDERKWYVLFLFQSYNKRNVKVIIRCMWRACVLTLFILKHSTWTLISFKAAPVPLCNFYAQKVSTLCSKPVAGKVVSLMIRCGRCVRQKHWGYCVQRCDDTQCVRAVDVRKKVEWIMGGCGSKQDLFVLFGAQSNFLYRFIVLTAVFIHSCQSLHSQSEFAKWKSQESDFDPL